MQVESRAVRGLITKADEQGCVESALDTVYVWNRHRDRKSGVHLTFHGKRKSSLGTHRHVPCCHYNMTVLHFKCSNTCCSTCNWRIFRKDMTDRVSECELKFILYKWWSTAVFLCTFPLLTLVKGTKQRQHVFQLRCLCGCMRFQTCRTTIIDLWGQKVSITFITVNLIKITLANISELCR